MKYAGQVVTVEGPVVTVGQTPNGSMNFLNFSKERNGFTVVIRKNTADQIKANGITLSSLQGQTVQVTGKVDNNPKYGLQIMLDNPAGIKVSGKAAVKPAAAPAVKTAAPAVAASGKVIQQADVTKFVNQNVILEGTIEKVGKSPKSETYFLNFPSKPVKFTTVIFAKVAEEFKQAKIDINSYSGKKVQITGKIVFDEKFGHEILLDKKDSIKIVK